MIPNVFISSTVRDLHYLRDAIREAVEDLHYTPVMSEYGEVGYISPTSAAMACYRKVEDCQIFVLIIGRAYNPTKGGGLSVTHQEYRTARDRGIPIITFIERDVLNFEEVYKENTTGTTAVQFPRMDSAEQTFRFIAEIKNSPTYSGIIPFSNSSDAKKLFKIQLADLVGQKLLENSGPLRLGFEAILSEVKTLRYETEKRTGSRSQEFLSAVQFLLTDAAQNYRGLLKRITSDVDEVIPTLIKEPTLTAFFGKLGLTLRRLSSPEEYRAVLKGLPSKTPYFCSERLLSFRTDPSQTQQVGCVIFLYDSKTLYWNESEEKDLERIHQRLLANLNTPISFFGKKTSGQ